MKMGKKGNWFSAVKKALSPDPKEKKDQRARKPKKKWFGKSSGGSDAAVSAEEEMKLSEMENEQSKHAYSVALATTAAAEAAVAAAHAAAEVVRLTAVPWFYGIPKDEVAAIRIQTAFRGYLARRALRALRGLVRLKTLIQGQSVKRQAMTTLRCMQTLARVQSQIRARRIRMSEENQALQRQLQQKTEKELDNLRASMGEDWNDSTQSREQIEARLLGKQEAAMRRERALAYAFSHQTVKNTAKCANPTFMDPSNPHWGWSWLERWMAARPWESRTTADFPNRASVKSAAVSAADNIGKAYHRRDLSLAHRTPPSKAPSSVASKGLFGDEDSRSLRSVQSEMRYRRHSIAGSSVRDDESLASSPCVPSYMAATHSARAKSRLLSPLSSDIINGLPAEKPTSVKKRLSFHGSPARPRRHSGPPKYDVGLTRGQATP